MVLGQTASPLQDDFIIEWGRFFDGFPPAPWMGISAIAVNLPASSVFRELPAGKIVVTNEWNSFRSTLAI
jgi:hypothetical protein